MFRITIITLMLCSISLSSCLKENGHWANDAWDSLPESGYYEWLGNTQYSKGTYVSIDSLEFITTPVQAGFMAGYKFIFQPKALARVEFIINGQVVMSNYLRTVEKDLIYSYLTLGDNSSQAICQIQSHFKNKNELAHRHFTLLSTERFYDTAGFGEGYPFFKKTD